MNDFNIEEVIIRKNLEYIEGVWYSLNLKELSYPESGYDDCYAVEDKSFWFKHRNNCIIEVVKKFSPNSTVFDVGGGNGFVSLGLINAGIEAILIEPGRQGVLNAKARGLKKIICSSLEDGIKDKRLLPAIGVFDVLEHISEEDNFLFRLKDFLSHDGMLYITVPAYNALWSSEDEGAGHFRRYTLESLEQKLNRAGYNVEYSTYIFSILPLPIFLFRRLPILLKLKRKGKQFNNELICNNYISKILDKIWGAELKIIRENKRMPFGGSCLVVAKSNVVKEYKG